MKFSDCISGPSVLRRTNSTVNNPDQYNILMPSLLTILFDQPLPGDQVVRGSTENSARKNFKKARRKKAKDPIQVASYTWQVRKEKVDVVKWIVSRKQKLYS